MKKLFFSLLTLILLLTQCAWNQNLLTAQRAQERAEDYAYAIDHFYEDPAAIYVFMTQDFREEMSEEQFCAAFAKERSYPYITPLYISKPKVELNGSAASVVYDQAARLPGMNYKVSLIFENGDWFVQDWQKFLDGSYLDKFVETPYSLDWYYDTESMKEGK